MSTKNRRRLENRGQEDVYYAGSIPEVVVTGNKPSTYRSYYSEFNDKILNTAGDYLKRAATASLNGIGNLIAYPLKASFWLEDKFGSDENKYSNAVNDFTEKDNIYRVGNGVRGEMNLLGMMGAVKKDGKYYFRNPNSKSGYLRWCAENANMINRFYGRPTAGNAWTRHGIYGDSNIVVSPHVKQDYYGPAKHRRMAGDQADYVKEHIDDDAVELRSGDIVDMYYDNSDFKYTAFREGDKDRTNSHTGTIIKTGTHDDKTKTFVAHYMGNGLKVEPIGRLLGTRLGKPFITGIRRPGTKDHPYK